ncbi:hypothetical protein BGZ47_009868 [Haplosporangium gracile]|nr:hypothetical protein BGZ47_009868 [Haplosporangium gracile]
MMPTLARHKFFEVPELVEQFGPSLRPHDLAQLLRTSRSLYAAIVLHFWRYVEFEDDHRVDQLITSPTALDALGVTRHLELQEQQEEEETTVQPLSITNTRIQRPPWLAKAVIQTSQARSLPPMTRLTQLDICFDRRYQGVQLDNAMRTNRAVAILLPLTWLMTFNTAGLKRVTFRQMYSPEPLETEMPERGITGPWLTLPMVFILFFAFPTSVVSVKMEANVKPCYIGDVEELDLRTVQRATTEQNEEGQSSRMLYPDSAEGNLVNREESLVNLKELLLPICPVRYSDHDIIRIMEHCPALESWDISSFVDDVGAKSWVRIMDSLLDQHVESVNFDQYLDACPDKFVPALLRHSEVLQSVILKNSHGIESRTLAMILGQCHGLGTFWATMPKEEYGKEFVALALNHAIEREWVCTGIKSLRFTVDLAVQEYSGTTGSGGGSGRRTERAAGMKSFLKVDQPPKEHWQKLEAFYTQLGKLVKLKDLEIFCRTITHTLSGR